MNKKDRLILAKNHLHMAIKILDEDFMVEELEGWVDCIDQKIKNLHDIGALVWYLDCTVREGVMRRGVIKSKEEHNANSNEKRIWCCVNNANVPEDCLFSTKQELIESTIKFWQNLDCE